MPRIIRRVTIQDIADACSLSRVTVSKVFNGRGEVPISTKMRVLQKAREMGYLTSENQVETPDPSNQKSIALFTRNLPREYHFGAAMLSSSTDILSRAGYTMSMFEVSDEEIRQRILPTRFSAEKTAAILVIELFDPEYLKMICSAGLPVVVIDSPAYAVTESMRCDYVLMENTSSITALVRHLYDSGARRMGFVGDRVHCGSFYERWSAFASALSVLGMEYDEDNCLLEPDDSPYSDPRWIEEKLRAMPVLPDALVCANDYLAVNILAALKRMGKTVPSDVMVTGFDGSRQSELVEPSITTVRIPGAEIGRVAANIIMTRIHGSELPHILTYIKTEPEFRASTDKQITV